MIYGSIKDGNVLSHYNLLPLYNLMTDALSFDQGTNTGKVTLIDGLVYANFDEGTTEFAKDRKFEYHRDFLDVHIILSGSEKIGFCNELLQENDDCVEFDVSRDLGFLKSKPCGDYVTLKKGDFVIFAPLELHQPLCAVEKPTAIRKIVLKVHADYLKNMK